MKKTALTSNLSQQDITKTIATKNSFVREVLTIWTEINFEKQITSKTQFLSQSIWHNFLVRIANYPVFYPDWFNKGVTKVKDLKDDSDNFLSFNEFQIKFNLKACPLKYYGLLSALKSLWSTCQNNSKGRFTRYDFCLRLSHAIFVARAARVIKSSRKIVYDFYDIKVVPCKGRFTRYDFCLLSRIRFTF